MKTFLSAQSNCSFLEVNFDKSINKPIFREDESRFKSLNQTDPESHGIHAVIGSSFATSHVTQDLSAISQTTHVLDAYKTCYTTDEYGLTNGGIIAVADGCGHFQNEKLNKCIGNAARLAVEIGVQRFAEYTKIDELKVNISNIINDIKKEIITQSGNDYTGETTLAIARAFQIKEGMRVIGFNIGDSMLIAINPLLKTCKTIIPARVYSNGPSNIPSDTEYYEFDEVIDKSCILLGLTDGVYDYLPIIKNEYPDKKVPTEIFLDTPKMQLMIEHISIEESTQAYVEKIAKEAINQTENQRLKNPDHNIGDDFTLVGFNIFNQSNQDLLKLFIQETDNDERQKKLKEIVKKIPFNEIHYLFKKFFDLKANQSENTSKIQLYVNKLQTDQNELYKAYYKAQVKKKNWQLIALIAAAIFLTPFSLIITLPLWFRARREDVLYQFSKIIGPNQKDKNEKELFNSRNELRKIHINTLDKNHFRYGKKWFLGTKNQAMRATLKKMEVEAIPAIDKISESSWDCNLVMHGYGNNGPQKKGKIIQ